MHLERSVPLLAVWSVDANATEEVEVEVGVEVQRGGEGELRTSVGGM
jgi:hypothetical protein